MTGVRDGPTAINFPPDSREGRPYRSGETGLCLVRHPRSQNIAGSSSHVGSRSNEVRARVTTNTSAHAVGPQRSSRSGCPTCSDHSGRTYSASETPDGSARSSGPPTESTQISDGERVRARSREGRRRLSRRSPGPVRLAQPAPESARAELREDLASDPATHNEQDAEADEHEERLEVALVGGNTSGGGVGR